MGQVGKLGFLVRVAVLVGEAPKAHLILRLEWLSLELSHRVLLHGKSEWMSTCGKQLTMSCFGLVISVVVLCGETNLLPIKDDSNMLCCCTFAASFASNPIGLTGSGEVSRTKGAAALWGALGLSLPDAAGSPGVLGKGRLSTGLKWG